MVYLIIDGEILMCSEKKKKVCQIAKQEVVSRLDARIALIIVDWDFEAAIQHIKSGGKK